jgi:hypothetical protein
VQAKRDEAARLLAEADAQVAEVRRFSNWIDPSGLQVGDVSVNG